MTTRAVSGPSRKLPEFAVTGPTVGGHKGKGLLVVSVGLNKCPAIRTIW
jgi:hypothetical protein